MELMLLRIFQDQVRLQCEFALAAAEDISPDNPKIWAGIQNMMNAAANISKACWGSGGKKAAEREPLRSSLQIDEDSPIRWTTMRNHWEHLDERLDQWWTETGSYSHVDRGISTPGSAYYGGTTEIDIFRMLDPTNFELTFWGDKFDLRAITEEILRIHPLAVAESNKSHVDRDWIERREADPKWIARREASRGNPHL